jgi:hypothetical protein
MLRVVVEGHDAIRSRDYFRRLLLAVVPLPAVKCQPVLVAFAPVHVLYDLLLDQSL